ncbi:MAG: hypothetical protein ACE5KE_15895, partial [Methanosarcinales archaeon]
MEDTRIKFPCKKIRKKFFKKLKENMECKTFTEVARKLEIPIGRLKLWMIGERTIPLSLVEKWSKDFQIKLNEFDHEKVSLKKILKDSSRKGVNVLKKKYGNGWSKILGKKGRIKLQERLKKDKKLYKKWRDSIDLALRKKFGEDCYRKMGKIGGSVSINKRDPNALKLQLERAFRKSFKKRLIFNGQKFRSKKEIEVAIVLQKHKIRYKYEKKLLGLFPDFLLANKTIIEVVGFEWKPHMKRTVEKINRFLNAGYKLIIYTYP